MGTSEFNTEELSTMPSAWVEELEDRWIDARIKQIEGESLTDHEYQDLVNLYGIVEL